MKNFNMSCSTFKAFEEMLNISVRTWLIGIASRLEGGSYPELEEAIDASSDSLANLECIQNRLAELSEFLKTHYDTENADAVDNVRENIWGAKTGLRELGF